MNFKNIFILIIITILSFAVNSQELKNNTNDQSSDIINLKNEIDTIKKDIEILKEKTKWFSFDIAGSIKTTFGAAIKANFNNSEPTDSQTPTLNVSAINKFFSYGFDFENKIRLNMNFGNKIVASSLNKLDKGTEISLEIGISSLGISKLYPRGSWYVVKGKDDQDNTVDIYLPRYENNGSNVYFGNLQVILKEAKVKNIGGTGFFINYQDVTEVHQYYGINGMPEILKLNHEYFNNGFVIDSSDYHKYASLYYSFDAEYYEPKSEVATAVKLWSNDMLRIDPLDPLFSKYNQKPHGISFGYLKDAAEGLNVYSEIAIASKDAFDPRYYEDDQIDLGFLAKLELKLSDKKMFEFYPKLATSFAFQTDLSDDVTVEFSTFANGLSLPFIFKLPKSGKDDKIKFEINWDVNLEVAYLKFANFLSFITEFVLFNNTFFMTYEVIYSFKNSNEWANLQRGGFIRVGHDDVKWLDQLYDDHILNFKSNIGFDSRNLFGTNFEYRITDTVYLAFFRPDIYSNFNQDHQELYLFNIFNNEFILNEIGPDKLAFFIEFGVGYTSYAKLVDSTFKYKYTYNRNLDTWTKNSDGEDWIRWGDNVVMSLKTGFYVDIIKNLSIGLSVESPKLLLGALNPIGNQYTFCTLKLWSEIKL